MTMTNRPSTAATSDKKPRPPTFAKPKKSVSPDFRQEDKAGKKKSDPVPSHSIKKVKKDTGKEEPLINL